MWILKNSKIIHHSIFDFLVFIVNLILIFYHHKEFVNFHYYINKLIISYDLFNLTLHNKMKVFHLIRYYKNYLKTKQLEEVIRFFFWTLKIYYLFCNEFSYIDFYYNNIEYSFLILNNFLFILLNLFHGSKSHFEMQ